MPPRKTSAADLSAKLDALDDKILDLVVKRAALDGPAAPAEQARRLRRLAGRDRGTVPLAGLVRIWREMMATAAPAGRNVHVYAADRAGQFRDLARDLFGSRVQMKSHLSANAIVHECNGDPNAFGVVPPPESDESARAWWAQLAPPGQNGPRVVAALPLIGAGAPAAYVIGSLDPEASGDDTTLVRLEAGDSLSLTRLQSLLKQGGLEARLVAVGREPGQLRLNLLEIKGFLTDDDARLGQLREQGAEGIQSILIVGSYANPLDGASAP